MKYLKKFDTHTEYEEYIASDYDKPNVSLCVAENEVHYNPIPHDYSNDYLTFVARADGTFTFSGLTSNTLSYSLDNGSTWTELANNTPTPTVASGNKILWKCDNLTTSALNGPGRFFSTSQFDVEGNIMSLIYGDNFIGQTTLTSRSIFSGLFSGNTNVIEAENLLLPATQLSTGCYLKMFCGCTNLISAPDLPAKTLSTSGYCSMFESCTSLTKAPKTLPTTLASSGCCGMFANCTSLVNAPELPATTLASKCYWVMFLNCSSLRYIKAMFTTTPSASYTENWVNGVAANGTFVKNSAAQWNVSGANGIPNGWTVETASE